MLAIGSCIKKGKLNNVLPPHGHHPGRGVILCIGWGRRGMEWDGKGWEELEGPGKGGKEWGGDGLWRVVEGWRGIHGLGM